MDYVDIILFLALGVPLLTLVCFLSYRMLCRNSINKKYLIKKSLISPEDKFISCGFMQYKDKNYSSLAEISTYSAGTILPGVGGILAGFAQYQLKKAYVVVSKTKFIFFIGSIYGVSKTVLNNPFSISFEKIKSVYSFYDITGRRCFAIEINDDLTLSFVYSRKDDQFVKTLENKFKK